MSDKPVYQIDVAKTGAWFECTQEQFEEIKSSGAVFIDFRILYPSAAYEAQRNEVERLKAETEAQAKQIDEVKAAISEYYHALDNRQHGGVAQDRAFTKVQMALGMQWIQGASLAASKNGDSK